jgi:hypothetical protein
MATPQQDSRPTQEKSANSILDESGLNDLDADDVMLDWNGSGDDEDPKAQRNLADEMERAKTPTPTKLMVWKEPLLDRERVTRERTLEELDDIIERGTKITMELFEEAPEKEELAKFSLPQMTDASDFDPMWKHHKDTDHCPLFGCGRSHIDYKHLRNHLTAHREQLLKGNAWQKEGYPADMLRSKDDKSIDRTNIETVKIFHPQVIKLRGCPDEKHSEKWETFEKFADRVFRVTNFDVSAAKRLWYKRSEIKARLQKYIYELDLDSAQKWEVQAQTHPGNLFYKEGEKRTIAEVRDKIQELKQKRHAFYKKADERHREYVEERERQGRDREDRGDRDRRGKRGIEVRRERDRQGEFDEVHRGEEKKQHNFVVVKKTKTGQ